MIEETLFYILIFAFWVITFVLMWIRKEALIPAVGGIIGIFFGIELISSSYDLIGTVFIVIAFYQLYVAVFEKGGK